MKRLKVIPIFFFLALQLEKTANTQIQIKDCSTMQRCYNLFLSFKLDKSDLELVCNIHALCKRIKRVY